MHLGTGCDYLSKIGTKYPALDANPEVFLSDFGKGLHPATDQLSKAKAYLVKLFPHSKGLRTFHQLRVNQFHVELTSDFSGDAHCTMEVFSQGNTTLLYDASLKISRLDHGWIVIDDELLPQKYFNIIPGNTLRESVTATKGDCSSKRCGCKKDDTVCSQYCLCAAAARILYNKAQISKVEVMSCNM